MPLEIAPHAGFCMGVRRAVEAAERIADEGTPACTLGELIHNPQVVESLRSRGVPPIASPSEAQGRRVLIRSHGVGLQTLAALEAAGCEVVDLTCPFVSRLHRIAREASEQGRTVIVVGEARHPEVQGTVGWITGEAAVVATEEEAAALPPIESATVCAQTTFPPSRWDGIVAVLRAKIPDLDERCTICPATEERQREACELAARSDAMIVIGGRHSANTRKLYESCLALCPRTILAERAAEIPPAFANIHSDRIGITAGASTPDGSLKEVVTTMTDNENMVQATNEEAANNDFMAQIEETFVRYRKGQTVTGKVIEEREDEIIVNIGGKSDGLIKRSDLSDKDVKVGDEIEVEVVNVNDGEGNVVLSQRNIVDRKAWAALMAKYEAGEYVEGVGKEAVKGGLIADVGGVRAFVPASQLAPRYVDKIGDFVGKDMKLKIIEVDDKKKRIVASRKAAILEESAAKKEEAWSRLEEGIVIHGIVRRLTSFGAFVDVGGVDGLVHITDLSWGHIKDPSDVVKPNQEIDVKVLSLDRERERIQLGYKQLQPKPWDNAAEKYPEGAIVEGKAVRIVTFGAFVELEPGLDGLVHISQCAPTKIAKVEDAVNVGDIVRAKVLSVDTERKRISLSIRQALEDEAMDDEQLDVPAEAEEAVEAVEEAVEPAAEAVEAVAEAAEEAAAEA
ncbi:MAG: bifunctional 4-hydroxy-3-methylbut-2-enyl diphosphate reductase/30S ribosomal protein S1 [Clostridia bacterium]|nr:bifunctional 4-hydroxy-3-methylbut-2-enyl diphosphate reductase/30S ribosomal protein S1 [Clostridia bacterium]